MRYLPLLETTHSALAQASDAGDLTKHLDGLSAAGRVKMMALRNVATFLESAAGGRLKLDDEPTLVPPELAWLHSTLPDHCFVSVHAETLNRTTQEWTSGSWRPQPFKSTVDPTNRAVYWHKDALADFYGELWEYDDDTVRLRMETFPKFPEPYENASLPWDPRPDKFRLYFSGGEEQRMPGGHGRILAPRRLRADWLLRDNTSTALCSSWAQFAGGTCAPYQHDFLDSGVSVKHLPGPFSTTFDGPPADAKWAPDASMHQLTDVVVINQEQAGVAQGPTLGRERFFFASLANGSRLGIVRWDAAVANASAPDGFTVTARTAGLRTACDDAFNSSGFAARRRHDQARAEGGDVWLGR